MSYNTIQYFSDFVGEFECTSLRHRAMFCSQHVQNAVSLRHKFNPEGKKKQATQCVQVDVAALSSLALLFLNCPNLLPEQNYLCVSFLRSTFLNSCKGFYCDGGGNNRPGFLWGHSSGGSGE